MRTRALRRIAFLAVCLSVPALRAETWTLENITGTSFQKEVFRLPVRAPSGETTVTEDGRPIPSVVDARNGERTLYVSTTVAPGESRRYEIAAGKPVRGAPQVQVTHADGFIVLDNGLFAIKIPERAAGEAPAPVAAVRLGKNWVGRGRWETAMPFKQITATVIDDGAVMGKARLRYTFDGVPAEPNAQSPAFAEIDVTVLPDCPFARIEERYAMAHESAWSFEATAGWHATGSAIAPHSGGLGMPRDPAKTGTLQSGQIPRQDPAMLINLFPRWNQHCKDGWYGAATGADGAVGAVTLLAGRWYWPHDSSIRCLVRESADTLTLRCPTVRGARTWWLMAGPVSLFTNAKTLVTRRGFESLDTIVNDIPIRDWPGVKGSYRGYWPLSSDINPTGRVRGWGKSAVRDAGKTVRSIEALTQMQTLLSPHTYGSYWLFWSPENPNFFTDFNKIPIAMACALREHPRFPEIAKSALRKFHEDVYHAIALPSGAGNECPGYQQYAMHEYAELAALCAKHLGEDPMQWPQLQAAPRYLIRLSQPAGGGKRSSHPGGDTHPGYVNNDPRDFAAKFGAQEDVSKLVTEELRNFGVVFRNRCGTDRETYLAFKSGPARGHYHGDQLSFHYCANAKAVAVDHHCSYHPRAGQEHMHNRLSFSTDSLPFANLDGYERVIAFKAGERVDVAIGEVESLRLREVAKLPPENWHQEFPQVRFQTPLRYRRTIVLVKGETDYFVIRDQFAADRNLHATFNLHVLGETCEQQANRFRFDGLTLFAAAPAKVEVSRLDWEHENGGREATKGVRLSIADKQGEFITVLHPGAQPPEFVSIPGGVRVGTDEIRFAGGMDNDPQIAYVTATAAGLTTTLTGQEIDPDRSQGDVGLFVPDAGYPFGEIPDWLIRSRSKIPDWAPDWVRQARQAASR